MNNSNHSTAQQLEHPVLVSLVVLVAVLLGQGLGGHGSAAASGRGEVLEHALAVRAQHPLQRTRHRVRPEEVVVQSRVGVNPLAGVEGQQLVYQVTGVRVLNKRNTFQFTVIITLIWSTFTYGLSLSLTLLLTPLGISSLV